MMTYTTSQAHYPGALSTDAVILLKCFEASASWQPEFSQMNRAQIDGLAQLTRAGYVEARAWWQYRAQGGDTLATIKSRQDARNRELNVLYGGQDPLVTLWEAKAQILDWRLRPWRLSLVNEAHNQHMLDCQLALTEWRAS